LGIVNVAIVLFIGVYVVFGMYRGFLHSALSAISCFVSFIAAYLLHPLLSWALSRGSFMTTVISYTEGAGKLNLVSIDQVYLPVKNLTATAINDLVDKSSLVSPYDNLVKQNMVNQSLAGKGLLSVGDYFDSTVAYASLNILSMLLLFLIFRIAIGIFLAAVNTTHPYPVLKHYDGLMGALMGLVKGVFICYMLVALLPVLLSIVDSSTLTEKLLSVPLVKFFYSSNFVLLLTRGTIL
jgi:uncharacterized membrane protein required for colicin V production